ncbi:leucine-rich repeat-containing protein 15-like [Culicoides brevitarsis]|uniref:leucine-rich repeat-containing protein 15-like n=1 Tax=Culicoides brevitarsis TaxID=469753 RepID=UPI00307B4C99
MLISYRSVLASIASHITKMDLRTIFFVFWALIFASVSGRDISCGSSSHFTIGFMDSKEIICATTHITLAENDTLRYTDARDRDFNVLEYYGCQLNTFPAEVFEQFSHLRKVKMPGNDLKSIKNGSFEKATSLRELHLNRNKLESVGRETFRGAASLVTLNLEHNSIKNVDFLAFDTLVSLENLNLAYNLVTEVPVGLFASLTNLKELHFYSNKLTFVHPKAFWHNKKLEILDLEGNFLVTLDLHINSRHLSLLDVTNNDLTSLKIDGNVKNSTSIRKILASNNHIRVINVEKNLQTEIIDLSRNKLEGFSDISLPWKTLKSLSLAFNPVKTLPHDEKYGNLQHLDVSFSLIDMKSTGFGSFSGLKVLYIKGLKLNSLPLKAISGLDNLQVLNLHENDLRSFDYQWLLVQLPNLSQISFDTENFTCDFVTNLMDYLRNSSITVVRDDQFPLEIDDFLVSSPIVLKVGRNCRNQSLTTTTPIYETTLLYEISTKETPKASLKATSEEIPVKTHKNPISRYYNAKILLSLISILIVVVVVTALIVTAKYNIGPTYGKFRNSLQQINI